EIRSCLITAEICRQELKYDEQKIKFIQSVMYPKAEHTGVIYQIVANSRNGMDVDKYDYLARDPYNLGLNKSFNSMRLLEEFIIDEKDNLAYSKHCSHDVLDMFL